METWLLTVERWIHAVGSIAVLGILWVEIDDVYGFSNIRKLSKRRWRKFIKKFMRESKRYFRKKVKESETLFHESNSGQA